jgi:hypothetical protein
MASSLTTAHSSSPSVKAGFCTAAMSNTMHLTSRAAANRSAPQRAHRSAEQQQRASYYLAMCVGMTPCRDSQCGFLPTIALSQTPISCLPKKVRELTHVSPGLAFYDACNELDVISCASGYDVRSQLVSALVQDGKRIPGYLAIHAKDVHGRGMLPSLMEAQVADGDRLWEVAARKCARAPRKQVSIDGPD